MDPSCLLYFLLLLVLLVFHVMCLSGVPSVNVVPLWDDMDQLMRYKLALFFKPYSTSINSPCFFLFCHSFEFKVFQIITAILQAHWC